MAAQSSYPAYKAALRTALNAAFAADPALAQVRAYAAMIGDDPLPLEFVEWHGTEDIGITWAALGNLRIKEEYTLTGAVFILKPGAGEDVADAARLRVFAIFNAVAATVRADPSLGGVVLRSGPVTPGNPDERPVEGGRAAALLLRLPVYTELTP
jgi:hypothetical protein